MADNLTKEQRSKNMSRILSKNTKPEVIFRKKLHSLGYRYSLHKKELPGKPDLYLKKYNLAIFIHGCFWHQHGCKYSGIPKTNKKFWKSKFDQNTTRDDKNLKQLNQIGVRYEIIWECDINNQIEKELKRVVARTANLKTNGKF